MVVTMGNISFGIHGYETTGSSEQFVLSAVMAGPLRGYMVFDRMRQAMEGSDNPEADVYKALPPAAYLTKQSSGWALFVRVAAPLEEGEWPADVAVAYPALVVRGVTLLRVRGEFSSRKAAVSRLETGHPFDLESPPATSQDIACRCGCR